MKHHLNITLNISIKSSLKYYSLIFWFRVNLIPENCEEVWLQKISIRDSKALYLSQSKGLMNLGLELIISFYPIIMKSLRYSRWFLIRSFFSLERLQMPLNSCRRFMIDDLIIKYEFKLNETGVHSLSKHSKLSGNQQFDLSLLLFRQVLTSSFRPFYWLYTSR